MKDIAALLTEQPFFAGLEEADLRLLAGCAANEHVREGTLLFREGKRADRFYLVRKGRIALEVLVPGRGRTVVDTLDAGEVVGWSWLVPPYRWSFDGRAVAESSLVAFDGACLRGKCDADPRLGYALMQRVSHEMFDELRAARVRLADLYGRPR